MQGVPSRHPPGIVCMLSGELTRYGVSMQSLMTLQAPNGSAVNWQMGMRISMQINNCLQSVIDNPNMQWAWIMGDDHTFDPQVLLRLLEHDLDVVAPLCLSRLAPLDPVIVEHDHKPKGRLKYLEDLPRGGLYKLRPEETCGDAGLLIRRHALERLGPPWYEKQDSGSHQAEDQEFIKKVKAAGLDVHIDLDNPIGHVSNMTVLPIRVNGHWETRLMTGGRHICDFAVPKRARDGVEQLAS